MIVRSPRLRKKRQRPPIMGLKNGLPLTTSRPKPRRARYALLVLAVVAGVAGWSEWGPVRIKHPSMPWQARSSRFRVWAAPPSYTDLPTINLTEASASLSVRDSVRLQQGSVLGVHVEEGDTDPKLEIDGRSVELEPQGKGDFKTAESVQSGEELVLRQGSHTLGTWKIHVISDLPPRIALLEQPVVSAHKTTRLSYEASDDYGLKTIAVRLTPAMTLPGIRDEPVDVVITSPNAKYVRQVDFQDLTFSAWAGAKVELQLVATDASGQTALSEKKMLTLPERVFLHPLARALVEERRKLLRQVIDMPTRDEAANIMAGIARQPASFRHDPVVLMALRSGAVRLVLDPDDESMNAVGWLLWHVAVRIEEGAQGGKQASLR